MENASKALIIAGAILLSILIIALGIFVFNQAKNATNTDSLEDMNVSTFNQVFTNYNGPQYGSQVASLLDAVSTNASNNKDADERLMDIIYLETRDGMDVSKLGFNTSVVAIDYKGALPTDVKNENASDFADALATMGTGDVKSAYYVHSDSTKPNTSGIGSMRNILGKANRHKFDVLCHTSANTGLVDFIVIKY